MLSSVSVKAAFDWTRWISFPTGWISPQRKSRSNFFFILYSLARCFTINLEGLDRIIKLTPCPQLKALRSWQLLLSARSRHTSSLPLFFLQLKSKLGAAWVQLILRSMLLLTTQDLFQLVVSTLPACWNQHLNHKEWTNRTTQYT